MKLEYIVKKEDENIRQILKEKFKMSDRLIVKLKHSENISVNNEKARIWNKISEGDKLVIEEDFEEESPNIVSNKKIKLDILYEDEYMLIVNKPPFIPVHPSSSHFDDSLSNGVKAYYEKIGLKKLIRPVIRLDKNTSGIVIFAKNEYIQNCLMYQMNHGTFKKYYLAILEGIVDKDLGTISKGISRKEGSVIERKIDDNGKEAISHYKVIKRFKDKNLTLVEYTLETGRTHQLRLHSKELGHPILGDSLYNKESALISRQALHSYKIEFIHPISNEKMVIETKIPEDMNLLINDWLLSFIFI